MPELSQDQFFNNAGWGDPAKVRPTRNARRQERDEGRAAVEAHNSAKEKVALGYKTEGRLYDKDHKAPTVTGIEKSRKKYEDSQRYG